MSVAMSNDYPRRIRSFRLEEIELLQTHGSKQRVCSDGEAGRGLSPASGTADTLLQGRDPIFINPNLPNDPRSHVGALYADRKFVNHLSGYRAHRAAINEC